MTAPAAVSWAAALGRLHLPDSFLAFFSLRFTPYIFTALAVGELVADKLPKTPSRKAFGPFAARVVIGAVCGAAVAGPNGKWIAGLLLGVVGAIAGTLSGYELRRRLVARSGGKDLPVALLEDALAIGGAAIVVLRSSA